MTCIPFCQRFLINLLFILWMVVVGVLRVKVYGWMISTQMTEYPPKVARGTAEAALDQLGRERERRLASKVVQTHPPAAISSIQINYELQI